MFSLIKYLPEFFPVTLNLINSEGNCFGYSLNEKTLDLLSDNNRLELVFQIMEDNILKVFKEKEKLKQELKRMKEENARKYDKLINDYENNTAKYIFTSIHVICFMVHIQLKVKHCEVQKFLVF